MAKQSAQTKARDEQPNGSPAQPTVEELQKAAQEVTKLVRLSQQENENEARNAAHAATTLMAKHDLVVIPRSELERVKKVISGAQAIAKRAKQEKWINIGLGFLGAKFLGGKGLRL